MMGDIDAGKALEGRGVVVHAQMDRCGCNAGGNIDARCCCCCCIVGIDVGSAFLNEREVETNEAARCIANVQQSGQSPTTIIVYVGELWSLEMHSKSARKGNSLPGLVSQMQTPRAGDVPTKQASRQKKAIVATVHPSTQNSPARNMGVQIGSLRSIHSSFTLQYGNICWLLPCPSICLQSTLFYNIPTCSPLSSLDEDVVLGTRVGSYFRKRCLQPSRTAERAGELCLSLPAC